MNAEVVAIVFTPTELRLVLRAVGELAEREGASATAADVLEMLDGALPADAMAGFEEWVR